MIRTRFLPASYRAFIRAASITLLLIPSYLLAADPAPFPGVELRIADETVPPGGMLQLKVEITEPTRLAGQHAIPAPSDSGQRPISAEPGGG